MTRRHAGRVLLARRTSHRSRYRDARSSVPCRSGRLGTSSARSRVRRRRVLSRHLRQGGRARLSTRLEPPAAGREQADRLDSRLAERTGPVPRPWVRSSVLRAAGMAPTADLPAHGPSLDALKPPQTQGSQWHARRDSANSQSSTPNLLIRRSPRPVHQPPQASRSVAAQGSRVHRRPPPSTPIHREWLPTWLTGHALSPRARGSLSTNIVLRY